MNPTPLIDVDRLPDIPTDELTHLAERFYALTVHMYEELCIRRTAERGSAEIERRLKDQGGDTS